MLHDAACIQGQAESVFHAAAVLDLDRRICVWFHRQHLLDLPDRLGGGAAALADKPAKHFSGLQNYIELFFGFLGGGFRQDLVNAVYYSMMLLVGAVGIGMVIAVLLDCKPRGEDIFRTIFLYPMSLSFIVTGTIWRWMLAPQGGVNLLPTFFVDKPLTFRWLTSTEAILEFDWQNLLQIIIYLVIILPTYR